MTGTDATPVSSGKASGKVWGKNMSQVTHSETAEVKSGEGGKSLQIQAKPCESRVKGIQAGVGFEPTTNGFAIRPI